MEKKKPKTNVAQLVVLGSIVKNYGCAEEEEVDLLVAPERGDKMDAGRCGGHLE